MKVKLTYFKETGKYYSDGEYDTNLTEYYEILEEVKKKLGSGDWPGLTKGFHDFHILVFPVDFYPTLIFFSDIILNFDSFPDTVLKVDGSLFRCNCGANVFKKLGNLKYRCNGCGEFYEGEID